MSYGLEFLEVALDEWHSLDATLKRQLQKKLQSRLENPAAPSAALREMAHCYKIRLRASGIRLVYQVIEERLVVLVVSVGKRDRSKAYNSSFGVHFTKPELLNL
jgi:mRNA interferase RelE/StbE